MDKIVSDVSSTQLERVERATPLQPPNRREVTRTFRLDMLAAALYSAFSVATVSFPAVLIRKEGAADWIVSLSNRGSFDWAVFDLVLVTLYST